MSYLYDPTSVTDWNNGHFTDLGFATPYSTSDGTLELIGNTIRVDGSDYGIVGDMYSHGAEDPKNVEQLYLYNLTDDVAVWSGDWHLTSYGQKAVGTIYSNGKAFFSDTRKAYAYDFANETATLLNTFTWPDGGDLSIAARSYATGMCKDSSYIYFVYVHSYYDSSPTKTWKTYVEIVKTDPTDNTTTTVFTSDPLVSRTGDDSDKHQQMGYATALCKDSSDYLYYVVYNGQKAAIYHVKTDGTSSAQTTGWFDTYWSGYPDYFSIGFSLIGSNRGHLIWRCPPEDSKEYVYTFSSGSVSQKIQLETDIGGTYGYYLNTTDPYDVLLYGQSVGLNFINIDEGNTSATYTTSIGMSGWSGTDVYCGGIIQDLDDLGYYHANLLPVYNGEETGSIRVPRVEIL